MKVLLALTLKLFVNSPPTNKSNEPKTHTVLSLSTVTTQGKESGFTHVKSGVSEMAQRWKTPSRKLDDLTLIPGTHMIEGKN